MSILTITAKGQITLRKDLLQHLGVARGEKIAVDKLPDGRIEIRAEYPGGKISDVFDLLKKKGGRSLSVEEIRDIAKRGWAEPAMKVTADTTILVRAITGDEPRQSKLAQAELTAADAVMLALPALCELVWVLSQGYKIQAPEIAEAIRRLIHAGNVVVNRPAVEAGLAVLAGGGDFADGIIAYEGEWLGAETFLSFDKEAARLLRGSGRAVRLLT